MKIRPALTIKCAVKAENDLMVRSYTQQRCQNLLSESEFPGDCSDWYGWNRYDFTVNKIEYCVVAPKKTVPQKYWIWRAEFFGVEPQVDLALLKKGWHVVYVKSAAGLYGSPKAVRIWNTCYKYLTRHFHLAPKVVLEGFSRGGLLVYNWAAVNPEKVACIYADAPVCDIKSWPGGKGRSAGSPEDWRACLRAYSLKQDQAIRYAHNPIDNLKPLAKANVPLLHVYGDVDEVVPVKENTEVVAKRYQQLGGSVKLIRKRHVGHHPHSLKNPKAIVDFILYNQPAFRTSL